jgi:hypothetical protein
MVVPHTDLSEVTACIRTSERRLRSQLHPFPTFLLEASRKPSVCPFARSLCSSRSLLTTIREIDVPRVVLVEVGPVVVLSSSKTSSSWMLTVLADTTVTGRDVSSVLSSVGS